MALPTITATRAYVRNLDSGTVYYTKGSGTQVIASVVKLMTAYTLLTEHPSLAALEGASETVAAGDLVGGSGTPIFAGDVITRDGLLFNMMIPSSNDSCNVLARAIGDELGGSPGGVTRFLTEMNSHASALGMSSTNYADAHGISGSNTSTPEDQYLLVKAIYDASWYSILRDMWAWNILRITITRGTSTVLALTQTHELIGETGIVGGKTGSTSVSNLVTLWEAPNGQTIYIGLMDADIAGRFTDTRDIIAQLVIDFPALATPANPWTPAYLFEDLGIGGAWWDASDTAHMWQDTGKTTAVAANDDPVAWWEPKSASISSQAWRQTTSANRPLWKSATNKLAFDGTNDYLTLGATSFGSTGYFADSGQAFLATVVFDATDATSVIFAKASASGTTRTLSAYFDDTVSTNIGVWVRGTSMTHPNDMNDGAQHTLSMYWSGTRYANAIDADGPKHMLIGAEAEESQNITLAARTTSSPAAHMTGSVFHVILSDEAIPLDQFRRLRDWARGDTVNAFADPTGGVGGRLFGASMLIQGQLTAGRLVA